MVIITAHPLPSPAFVLHHHHHRLFSKLVQQKKNDAFLSFLSTPGIIPHTKTFERKEKTRRHLEIKYFKNNSFDKRKNKKQNRYKAKDKSKRVTRLIVDIIPVRVKRDKKTVQSTLCVCVFVGHL
jgi:hypothetical protein